MKPSLLDLAEDLNAHLPVPADTERIFRPTYCLWLGASRHPALNVVQRFRLTADSVEATVAAIRAELTKRDRPVSTWEVGPSATPSDLVERLTALGMRPYEEPVATGMVLRRPLGAEAHPGVVARRTETVDELVCGYDILHAVFHERDETAETRRSRAERDHADPTRAMFLAWVGGRPVAAAHAIAIDTALVTGGGATLPDARGRGAYRALVAARYAVAVQRGTPALVVQAGHLSKPILESLGFEALAGIHILVDEVGATPPTSTADGERATTRLHQ